MFLNLENKGDSYYEKNQFSKAVLEYKSLLYKIDYSPKTKLITSIKNRINDKIKTTNENGSSFVKNKIISNCSLARRKNFQYGLAKDNAIEGDIQENREIIKQSLENARLLLLNSEFVDNSLIELYNKTVNKVNQDNNEKIALPITSVQTKLSYTNEKINSSFIHFPGEPQMNWEKKINDGEISFKSNILYLTAISSLSILGIGTVMYSNDQRNYNNINSNSLLYFSSPELLPYLLINDIKKFSEAREKVNHDANLINSSLGIFGFIFLLSNLDIYMINKSDHQNIIGNLIKKPLISFDNINLFFKSKTIYTNNLDKDSQIHLEFNHNF